MPRQLPKYVTKTQAALTELGLKADVIPRSLRHPWGPRLQILIDKRNEPSLTGLGWDVKYAVPRRSETQDVGLALVADKLREKINANEAIKATLNNRGVDVILAEKNKKKDTFDALHVVFPRNSRILRALGFQ